MILTKKVLVNITNNAKFYKKYGDLKQGQIINVLVSDLPVNSNKIVEVVCDDCNTQFNRSLQNLNKQDRHLCYDCTRSDVGKKMDVSNIVVSNRQRIGLLHPRYNMNKTQFQHYKNKVYSLTKTNYIQNKGLINPNNYLRTICGVKGGYQLDHIVSIKEGFNKSIDPKIIASKENLQMLTWQANRNKWHTLSEIVG